MIAHGQKPTETETSTYEDNDRLGTEPLDELNQHRVRPRSFFDDVGAFHKKFGLVTAADGPPTHLPLSALYFRLGFMIEELCEITYALGETDLTIRLRKVRNDLRALTQLAQDDSMSVGNLALVADGLADLVYVALGTAQLMRLPFNEVWDEVHRANLTKERASSAEDPRSTRGHTLDVVKPADFRAPDVEGIIERAQRRAR